METHRQVPRLNAPDSDRIQATQHKASIPDRSQATYLSEKTPHQTQFIYLIKDNLYLHQL